MSSNNIRFMSLTILFAICSGPAVLAQEEGEAPAEEFTQQRMVIASADEEGGMADIQVWSSDGVMGEAVVMGDSMFPAPDVFSLANNRSVQKEIELVDEQMDQIRKINKDFSEQISEHVKGLASGNMNPDRGRELSSLIKDLNDQKRAKMESVLLPHQFDRLRQIALQTKMQRNGDASTLGSKQVAEALGISDEQQRRIEERAAEIKKEMQEKIAKMKEKAQEELLGELTGEQRSKLKEMLGEKFELKTPDFRERINRFRKSRDQRDDDSNEPDDNRSQDEDACPGGSLELPNPDSHCGQT